MEHRLIQKQTQRMILSPLIQQYLKVLQMPSIELSQAVEAELVENPLLEEVPQSIEDTPSPDPPSIELKSEGYQELKMDNSLEHLSKLGAGYDEVWDYSEASDEEIKDRQKKKNYQETLITAAENLTDFLVWQIRFVDLCPSEREIAAEIIGNIDDDGYLKTAAEEIAAQLKADISEVESVLSKIQRLDPPGVGARTLQETLLIQLDRMGDSARITYAIVKSHFALIEKRGWDEIAREMDLSEDEIRHSIDMIMRLEPKPGRKFYSQDSLAVTPDASIEPDPDSPDKYAIEIHDEIIPELRVNSYYRKLIRRKDLDEKTRFFLKERLQRAINFIKAIGQRKSTLRAITEEIIKAQKEFLDQGLAHLKPLRLKDIAQSLGIHESTVSRAMQGKYVTTPQGTIPFKSFFSTKMGTISGGAESQKSIMEKMRSLISKEDINVPLSDEKIVRLLQHDGLLIARRTVAKYRDLLRVLPSHLRRKRSPQ